MPTHSSPSGGSRTPNSDRFIPSRMRGERLELSQYLLNVPKSNGNEVPEWMETEEQRDMKQKQKALSVTLAGDIKKAKVLNFCGSPSKEGEMPFPFPKTIQFVTRIVLISTG